MKLRHTIILTGAVPLIVGAIFLAVTALSPTFAIVAPVTRATSVALALGFVLAGVGLLALTRPTDCSRLLARGAAGLLGALAAGGMTIILFGAGYIAPDIPPATVDRVAKLFGSESDFLLSIGFLCAAIALGALTLSGRRRAGAALGASLAITVGLVGLGTTVCFLLGLQPDDAGRSDGLLAATLFPAVGIGLFCAAKAKLEQLSAEQLRPLLDHKLAATTGTCLGLVALAGLLTFGLTAREAEDYRRLNDVNRVREALPAVKAKLQAADFSASHPLDSNQKLSAEIAGEISKLDAALSTEVTGRTRRRAERRQRTAIAFFVTAAAIAALLGAVHLLSQRESAASQRHEATLRRHNETLKNFAHTVAHDLRAPLRGIAGYAAELEGHSHHVDERGRYCIAQINVAAQNLERLIRDTLDYAQLDTETLHLTTISLPTIVASLLQQRAPEIRRNGAQVDTHFGIVTVTSWERGLVQIIGNLLDNAIKFSRHAKPPRLRIETAQTPLSWQLVIYDNGLGFDMKYHDRIFGLFQRLVTPAEFEGTGAGLAIVRKITDRLGGSVCAQGRAGGGATFLVELPRIVSSKLLS
jgi:signal transduction histidine kinase